MLVTYTNAVNQGFGFLTNSLNPAEKPHPSEYFISITIYL